MVGAVKSGGHGQGDNMIENGGGHGGRGRCNVYHCKNHNYNTIVHEEIIFPGQIVSKNLHGLTIVIKT